MTITFPARVHIDRARALDLDLSAHPEVTAAETLSDRADELEADASAAFAGQFNGEALANAYLAGKATLTDVRAAAVASLTPEAKRRVHDVLDRARQGVDAKVTAELRKIGDKWITEILRPQVNAIIEDLKTAGDTVGNAWTDSTIQLCDDAAIVAAFDQANALHGRLTELRQFAHELTGTKLTPGIAAFDLAEHRVPGLWTDIPSMPIYSTLEAIRRGSEPGIWLASEVAKPAAKKLAA